MGTYLRDVSQVPRINAIILRDSIFNRYAFENSRFPNTVEMLWPRSPKRVHTAPVICAQRIEIPYRVPACGIPRAVCLRWACKHDCGSVFAVPRGRPYYCKPLTIDPDGLRIRLGDGLGDGLGNVEQQCCNT